MIKRLTVTLSAFAALFFAAPLAANAGPVHQIGGGTTTYGCPSPLTAHPDGTCWP